MALRSVKMESVPMCRRPAVPTVTSVTGTLAPVNGVLILDVSQVQARMPNPQITEVSHLFWPDGAQSQMFIPITVKGREYLVGVDELGGGGGNATANVQAACSIGLPMFPMARIIDIRDEKASRIVCFHSMREDDFGMPFVSDVDDPRHREHGQTNAAGRLHIGGCISSAAAEFIDPTRYSLPLTVDRNVHLTLGTIGPKQMAHFGDLRIGHTRLNLADVENEDAVDGSKRTGHARHSRNRCLRHIGTLSIFTDRKAMRRHSPGRRIYLRVLSTSL